MIFPRAAEFDAPEDVKEKNFIQEKCKWLRDPTDRLELRLALIGWEARHWTLTYDDSHLPERYEGVVKSFQRFLQRCKRHRLKLGLSGCFDYVKLIEGLHGDKRYHIHFVASGAEWTRDELEALWANGGVNEEDVIRDFRGFRRLAAYFRKERKDGLRLPLDKQPLSWSSSLRLPESERWTADSCEFEIPEGAVTLRSPAPYFNEFGGFHYISYLVTDKSRACARARSNLKRGAYSQSNRRKEQKHLDGTA